MDTAKWELQAGGLDGELRIECESTERLLDLVAGLLFANSFFRFVRIDIGPAKEDFPWPNWPATEKAHEWALLSCAEPFATPKLRLLQNKHELFSTVLAEIHLGARLIRVFKYVQS